MDAKKCDRCGEFYISKVVVVDHTNVNRLYLKEFKPTLADKYMDLCPECKHDLDTWWDFKFKKEESEENKNGDD